MPNHYAYTRASTPEQNPENQSHKIAQTFPIQFDKIYTDICSGTIHFAKRDGGKKLLNKVLSGDTIYVARLDRLGRDVADIHATVCGLTKKGIKVIAIDNMVDFSTPIGKMVLSILAGFAEFELDMIKERTFDSLSLRRATGRRDCKSRYGWDDDADPIELEQESLRIIKDFRDAGISTKEIAVSLNSRMASPHQLRKCGGRRNGKAWDYHSVHSILQGHHLEMVE